MDKKSKFILLVFFIFLGLTILSGIMLNKFGNIKKRTKNEEMEYKVWMFLFIISLIMFFLSISALGIKFSNFLLNINDN
jgi:hypothetical protein